jgi:hypothetical protein
MSQKTNLNISPYFDDFDPAKNFHRVLFKPGFPVQSRELVTLQSILQNQIQSFGSHFFKDGSVVIPGNIIYDSNYYAVKINDSHLGLDVGIYLNELIGKKIKGQNSQITAIIQNVITKTESSIDTYTLYVKYLNSDANYNINPFTDGETLITLDTFKYGNTTINSGQTIASLINSNAIATGSAVTITEGVYFIRGTFVKVNEDTLILDQYTNTPSYRIGLNILESIEFASAENQDLFDNAKGFSNFSAPGADRLKISTFLSKKALTDLDDKNFIEILRISNGVIKKIQDSNTYSLIKEYIAKRTYDESGDYALTPFTIEVKDSLNNQISSDGIYLETQKTDQNNIPSSNLLSVKISPGKAYVKGFDIEKNETTILDVEKPRDKFSLSTSSVPFEMGNLLKINNISGSPVIGIDNNHTIGLYDQRKNSTIAGSGTEIGKARVYSFNLSNTPYSNSATTWDLYLFDIQTYTKLTLNQSLSSIECPISTYIKGLSSGASGYVVSSPTNETITITQTSGSFSPGEKILINGSTIISRTIENIRAYSISDIKSVYQDSSSIGLSTDFAADTFLTSRLAPNFNSNDILTISSSGIATCAGRNFSGISTNTIIKYQRSGFSTETFNRISQVSSDGLSITLSGVSTVAGICDGGVPNTLTNVTFSLGIPSIQNEENAFLYAKLNNKNISDVNFTNSDIKVTRQTTGKSTNSVGSLSLSLSDVGITSAYFETFDTERYSIFYSNGTVEPLTYDKFSLDSSGTFITFSGLTPNQSNVTINSTVKKNSIRNKQKIYVRSQKLEINKCISGISTTISGLSTSPFYGLRVEDEEISLNVPDVANIIAVYESVNISSPILDGLNFQNGLNLNTNSILGEQIVGQTSGAVAQIVTRNTSTKIEFVYLNSNRFINGETVVFKESNISAPIQSVDVGSYIDRTQEYTLDKGQREQYYDYSRIVRKNPNTSPARKLLVIYDYYNVPSSDNGDVYTVNSYDSERYQKDIPILSNNTRASDILDFRPRVSPFTSTSLSPFDFASRSFSSAGNNPTLVLSPNESSTIGYSFYLPRIDKIVLSKSGSFNLIKGVSSLNPKAPSSIDDSMDIAIIEFPAYLYSPTDSVVRLTNNKRYTMRDIESLENRIENLEIASSLSLLELNTQALQVLDSDGVNRFKSGFFVDNFKTNNFINLKDLDTKCVINKKNEELNANISFYSLKSEIGTNESANIDSLDFSSNFIPLDNNIKKTGDLLTLNYTEISAGIGQTYATAYQNVNPAGVSNYNGYVKLTPSSDTWVRSINSENGIIIKTQGEWNNSFVNETLLDNNSSDKFKSKNIQFEATGLQPNTQYYSFFDGNSSIDFIPKLLQISMSSGSSSFQVGETVDGYYAGIKVASFRLATPTHKKGIYNSITPIVSYTQNPYNTSLSLPAYSSASTTLNIDTYSLADDASGRFFGYLPQGAILIGKTSGAEATVSTQSLITDNVGDLIGCFFIRNSFQSPAPSVSFGVGTKTFKLSSSFTNSPSTTVSFTQNTFYANGIVNSQTYTESISLRRPSAALPLSALRTDPLSQTFRTDNDGMFLSSVDLYFADKDSTEKIFVEIRETDIGGTPKRNLVQDYARAELYPSGITTSSTGQVATNVKFSSPIYLEPNKQYAISLICSSSSNYKVWTAQTNQPTISTQNLPNAEQVIYSNNYIGGNLYKPQNGSIWNSSISEDLTFVLYKCNFTSSNGTAYFHNPNISVGSTTYIDDLNIPKLTNNPIKTLPRKLNVGITTSQISVVGNILTPGTKVYEGNAFGYIENVGGNIVAITTSNVGTGYSNGTFTSVPLYSITGYGMSATANITVTNNKISNVSIAFSGSGYIVGDVLGITTSSVVRGRGARLTVSSIQNIDTLYLTNVQGLEFSLGQPISYYNGSILVSMASTQVIKPTYVPNYIYSGNIFEVTQYNHGMQSNNNIVVISNVFPDTVPEPITANIVSNSLSISVASTSNFTSFEGKPVNASNPGYVLINNEVISYIDVGSQSLTIGQRSRFGSPNISHNVGDLLYKYELNGVSLSRINKQHSLPSNSTLKSLRGIDKYHLEFDRTYLSDKSFGDNQLSFIDERIVGGSNCKASQNIQFSSIAPYFNVLTPENTSVSSLLRTVSGTSVDGNESSFIDKGFEPVTLNDVNDLDSPRLIASRINEINMLSSIPNNKSLTLGITLSTNNTNLSPVVDVSESATFVVSRNRINNPISDYASDSRSNLLVGDPHSSVYISNRIDLKQPATSLKVLLTSYRHFTSDFRVLYKLFKADSSEISQSYQLFPGYKNLNDQNGDGIGETIIDVSLNDGLPDKFVKASNDDEFLEYQFTADNLEGFTGFVIKIVMSGTNEAYAPRFKDLRAIALV